MIGEDVDEKKYTCNMCILKFSSESKLKVHKQLKHVKAELYNCDKCEFTTRVKRSMESHVNSIHKGIKYECEECGHQSTQTTSLKAHKRTMHGIDLFKCQTCKSEFKILSKLKKHVADEHNGPDGPDFVV